MFTIIGLVIVFGAVAGGYAMAKGPFHVLNQPSEFVIIVGAALGTLLIKAPGAIRGQVFRALAASFKNIAPSKAVLLEKPDFVAWAHAEGFTVTPYTFRASNPGRFPSVKAEMEHFLYTLGVDALFTDNPDQFPRR